MELPQNGNNLFIRPFIRYFERRQKLWAMDVRLLDTYFYIPLYQHTRDFGWHFDPNGQLSPYFRLGVNVHNCSQVQERDQHNVGTIS